VLQGGNVLRAEGVRSRRDYLYNSQNRTFPLHGHDHNRTQPQGHSRQPYPEIFSSGVFANHDLSALDALSG
jgi:hypothetical protein